ncbi:DUF3667 domain-containing protein [Sphingomicrobium sp. XHP0235]|uniref:DUF3667 domain-containing protein n=1 Tax=Sphingomicrobium aquimarinum TaxID=3133971 RepID=UPI0031FE8275
MNGVEAAGELIGGAGAARAIEPGTHGAGGDHGAGPERCLNCGCALAGDYCHCCGQAAHVHKTIGGLLHDLLHGVLHLDGKFWNTLPLLVWKPGKLTRDYIDGHRARYISPIAFYLFTVVAMFALVVSVGDVKKGDVSIGTDTSEITTVEEADAQLAELDEAEAELEGMDGPGAGGARAGIDAARMAVQNKRSELSGEPVSVAETDQVSASGFWRAVSQKFEKFEENPGLYLYKMQTASYKLSWLLIPLSLPFLWLLFPFSRTFGLYDHAVFITYSISFMMMLTIVVGLLAKLPGGTDGAIFGSAVLAALLYAPFHMYRQLRGTYSLGRISALLRTILLAVAAWIVLGVFITMMFVLGVL